MRLSELSEIRKGIKLDARSLVNAKNAKEKYYEYWEADNFTGNSTMKFVADKELRKLNVYTNDMLLNYGDYLVYKHNNSFKIIRYEQLSGQVIPSDTFIVIRYNHNLFGDFLSIKKNKQPLIDALEHDVLHNTRNEIDVISKVEIVVSNSDEIEDANYKVDFTSPLDISNLPIVIIQKTIPLDRIINRIEQGELLLDDEFQLQSTLWKLETKSRFIESLILSLPVPIFYLDVADDDKWLIIDGLQRLNTIVEYLNGSFELTSLDFLNHLKGKKFNDLERTYQKKIEEYGLSVCMIQKGTPQSVKSIMHKNINSSRLVSTF